MWADHPGWARSCVDCQTWVIDPQTGRVVTSTELDPRSGRAVELPVLRAESGQPTPCRVCPKLEGREAKTPLAPAEDFGDYFWELLGFVRDARAVGWPPMDELTRAAAAAVAREVDRRERERLIDAVADRFAAAVRRRDR